jgi:hypothetical protein
VVVPQHPRQLAMVVIEAAVKRRHQRSALAAHPPPGPARRAPWVTLPGDQRLQHGPPGDPMVSVATVPSLIRASTRQPAPAAAPAGRARRSGRTAAGCRPATGGSRPVGQTTAAACPARSAWQPHRIQPVGLGPARQVLGRRGHSPATPPARGLAAGTRTAASSRRWTQATTRWIPWPASCSASSMMALMVAGTCHTLVARRPGLAGCGTRVHPIPDALAPSIAATRATSSSDASTSAVSPSWATSLPPAIVGSGRAAREPGGNRDADRRAQGNSARPCCRAPAPDCITASNDQGCTGVGGQPAPFSPLHGVPQGHHD